MMGQISFVLMNSKRAGISWPPSTLSTRNWPSFYGENNTTNIKQINLEWREILLPRFLFMVNEETEKESIKYQVEPHGQT